MVLILWAIIGLAQFKNDLKSELYCRPPGKTNMRVNKGSHWDYRLYIAIYRFKKEKKDIISILYAMEIAAIWYSEIMGVSSLEMVEYVLYSEL